IRDAGRDASTGTRRGRMSVRVPVATMTLMATVALAATSARAHELTMAEMEVRETAPGEFIWQWSASNDKRPMGNDLVAHWREGCSAGPSALQCGSDGLKGTLSMEGVGTRYSAAMVKVVWLDGQSRVYTLTAAQPSVQLYGSADDRRGTGEIARAYVVLGI